MTRVDFYLLVGTDNRELIACRLADKAYQLGHKVYIHTTSTQNTMALDDLLWTFRDGSFVPHALNTETGDPPPPVLLGHTDAPARDMDVLINLADEVPPFYHRFPRIAELVDEDMTRKARGRERYRYYKDQGCELQTHNLGP